MRMSSRLHGEFFVGQLRRIGGGRNGVDDLIRHDMLRRKSRERDSTMSESVPVSLGE